MEVELGFRLYMMRFGLARLAASLASAERPTTAVGLAQQLSRILTARKKLDPSQTAAFTLYLQGKPGSPRYTQWRNAIKLGRMPDVEQQDLWLASDDLRSSVGSLTENYFEDPVALAEILGLLQPKTNILLSRGRLSLLTDRPKTASPFPVDQHQSLFLGLWLLDVDCDWIWSFLRAMRHLAISEITVANRVAILLQTFEELLEARAIRSTSPRYAAKRQRLLELRKITQRNVREGLNLGQPWSWFLIPRLELLVDACLLDKRQPHDLGGYTLSGSAQALQEFAAKSERGQDLLTGYFAAHFPSRPQDTDLQWSEVLPLIVQLTPTLATKTGHCLLYEMAAAVCVLRATTTTGSIWEVPTVRAALRSRSVGESADVTLGVDKYGAPYSFRLRSST